MRKTTDNSFKGRAEIILDKKNANHVNQTTSTWVDPEAV